mgnify:CR=1 FL=1
MITTLHIKNIGIIEELTIDLNKGLNVLTGETGAGKTLIIDSLSILSGGRFSKEMIRKGENNSYVEACIYLPNNSSSIDENIIVSREINSNGRNLCKINGRMVTVNELKEFMSKIIEIHGQNDNQTLLDNKYHLKYLDGYIGNKLNQKQEYQNYYNAYLELEKKLKENYGDDKERQRKLDLLKYQYEEIKQAKLKEGEEEDLEDRKKIIVNAEKIADNLKEADNALGNNAIDAISIAIRALEKIEDIDSQYKETANNLKSSYYELQEIAREISSKREDTNFDEEERNIIEERLDIIHDLKRKYGNTISEILQYKQEIKQEIEHIENLEEYTNKLKKEKKEIEKNMDILAEKIHEIREKEAQELSNKINQELKELEMKNAKIHVRVEKQEEYNKEGKDNVAFYIQTNLGEDEKELSKIASGGEISRTMLGIKKVLADTDEVPILIFDEIDTGISGKAANSVAQKLAHIAKKHQVLCISHLPNIAAMADNNYFISKNIVNERTNTNIKQLNEAEILQEIARISSGEINEISLKYAEELRKRTKIA